MSLPDDAHRKLRAARAYAGIEQRDLAEALGYSRTHWGAVEAGRKGLPNRSVLEEAMRICGVPIGFLEQEGFAAFAAPAEWSALDDRVSTMAAELAMLRRDVREAQRATEVTSPVPDPRHVAGPGQQAAQRAVDAQTQPSRRAPDSSGEDRGRPARTRAE